jgi:hypothetical protein
MSTTVTVMPREEEDENLNGCKAAKGAGLPKRIEGGQKSEGQTVGISLSFSTSSRGKKLKLGKEADNLTH